MKAYSAETGKLLSGSFEDLKDSIILKSDGTQAKDDQDTLFVFNRLMLDPNYHPPIDPPILVTSVCAAFIEPLLDESIALKLESFVTVFQSHLDYAHALLQAAKSHYETCSALYQGHIVLFRTIHSKASLKGRFPKLGNP